MEKDIRGTAFFQEAEALHLLLRQPATGQISFASDVHASPDGATAVFVGMIAERLEGAATTRICQTDIGSADTRVLTFGPNTDRFPRYAPDGRSIAFLSDRHEAGDFQLYLLNTESGAARPTPSVCGWVEYLQWSPDGKKVLLGVAGHGADTASGQGAVTSRRADETLPSWMPAVDAGRESCQWRNVWVYDRDTDHSRRVSDAETNIWEAAWAGNDCITAIASPGPGEGLWYSAKLLHLEVATGRTRVLYSPNDQLGAPSVSACGKYVAVVEALSSDRGVVAGDLRLIETTEGCCRRLDTHGVDVTYAEWRSESRLLLAGHRGFDTVVAIYDVTSDRLREVWRSQELTSSARYIAVSGIGDSGDCVFMAENFLRAPELVVLRHGDYTAVKSFNPGALDPSPVVSAVERVSWKGADGLLIQGWLLLPKASAPHPLVMNLHGGPVAHSRQMWLGRQVPLLLLLTHGYAVFLPNPRGSSGRGQDFIRLVQGDLGGADALDLLAGLDALLARGLADPKRLGVMGGSYGGFMTSWLVTQDSRFAAAVSIAPHTNQVSEHLTGNIPHFVSLFLGDSYYTPGGKYFQRSPIMYANRSRTPMLNICGALDRCTPPQEALQFHNALLENGVTSVLVTYPEEGHGIRRLPAAIDYAARIVAWFAAHMPASH